MRWQPPQWVELLRSSDRWTTYQARRLLFAAPGLAHRFEHRLRPLSAGLAVPVFAFFAAGVSVRVVDVAVDHSPDAPAPDSPLAPDPCSSPTASPAASAPDTGITV